MDEIGPSLWECLACPGENGNLPDASECVFLRFYFGCKINMGRGPRISRNQAVTFIFAWPPVSVGIASFAHRTTKIGPVHRH